MKGARSHWTLSVAANPHLNRTADTYSSVQKWAAIIQLRGSCKRMVSPNNP